MSNVPLVSIFMPTFNQANFLQAAFDGVRSQSFKDFELIVVDDCSTDITPEIIRDAVLDGLASRALFRGKNSGTAAAPINDASRFAKGAVWTWISSDNVMHPNWLEILVRELQSESAYGAVYSAFRRKQSGKSWDIRRPHAYRKDDLIAQEECYLGPSFLIKADVWKSVGLHRDGTAHDYDHWLRVEEECWRRQLTLRYVDQVLCDYNAGEHQTVRRKPHLYNAPRYQKEARDRRSQRSTSSADHEECKSVREIDDRLRTHVGAVESLLDVGCGIRPQNIVKTRRHVGVDIHDPYIERTRSWGVEVVKHDLREGLPFGNGEFEIVWLSDIIEHLEKDEGRRLFEEAKRVAKRGIVVRSPWGFEKQEGDAWGLGGDHWQKHRSGWEPKEFDPEIIWSVPPGVNGSGPWFASYTSADK